MNDKEVFRVYKKGVSTVFTAYKKTGNERVGFKKHLYN